MTRTISKVHKAKLKKLEDENAAMGEIARSLSIPSLHEDFIRIDAKSGKVAESKIELLEKGLVAHSMESSKKGGPKRWR